MNTMVRNLVVGSAMFVLFWVGCSDDQETEDENGTTTVATTGPTSTGTMGQTGTTVSTAASSTTGAGATGPGCDDVPDTAPSNGNCVMTGGGGGGVGGAGGGTTAGQGGGVSLFDCNPVTSEPCNTAAGEACDFNGETASFTCFTSGNTQDSCQMCNNQNGPWCIGGFTCYSGRNVCRRYCCDDGDCGPTLTCQKNIQSFIDAGAPQIGLCMP